MKTQIVAKVVVSELSPSQLDAINEELYECHLSPDDGCTYASVEGLRERMESSQPFVREFAKEAIREALILAETGNIEEVNFTL